MQSTTTVPQWIIADGYIHAPEFDYDIGFERLSEPNLMDHMASKTWCDMGQLADVIMEVTRGYTTGNDDGET